MPPKRSTPKPPFLGSVRRKGHRAPSRIGNVAAESDVEVELNGSPSATRMPAAATLASGLTPRPQKFSTNYGAEAFQSFSVEHNRNYAMQSTDLGSALARAAKSMQSEKPREGENTNASSTENAAAPATSLVGKRKQLDPFDGTQSSKRRKTAQAADELADEDQVSTAPKPRALREAAASRQTSQEPSVAARSSRSAEPETDGSASRSPKDDESKVTKRARRAAAKSSAKATAPAPQPEARKTWDDLPVSRQAQNTRRTRSREPEVPATREEDASEEGDDVDMINLQGDNMGESAPHTPDRQNGTYLQVPAAHSSVPPTEKSYNTESVIYRNATLSTPQGPSSDAPASEDSVHTTTASTEQHTATPQRASAARDMVTPSPEANQLTNAVSTAADLAIGTIENTDAVSPLIPKPLPRQIQLSPPRAQTPESQTYNWHSTPNHRGIRSHSDSPNSRRFVATHVSHSLDNSYTAPMPQHDDEPAQAGTERQQHIRNSLLPPDEENFQPIRDIGAAPARPDLTSAFVRAHAEAPEIQLRRPTGARKLFAPDTDLTSAFVRAHAEAPEIQLGRPTGARKLFAPDPNEPEDEEPARRHNQSEAVPPSQPQSQGSKSKQIREWVQTLGTGWTHLSGSIWTIFDTLGQWQAYLFECAWTTFDGLSKLPVYLAASLWKHLSLRRLLVPLLLAAMAIAISKTYNQPTSFEGISLNNGIRWFGWQDWKNNLGQLVSPSFGHGFPGTSENYSNIVAAFKSHDKDINKIKGKDVMQDAALAKLEQILPEFVRMSDNKIPHEFYVAVRNLMHEDPQIPTLDSEGKISESHAKAIEKHINNYFWRWLKDNARQVRQIVGISQNAQLTDEELNRIVRQVAQEKPHEVVSKEEFLRIFKNQLTEHQDETAGHMKHFQSKLSEFRRQLQEVMDKASASMSKEEIQQRLDKTLNMFAGNAMLESFAKGRIKANDDEVTSAVNHFSIRSGALVDVYRTSPAYKWPNKAHLGHKRFQTENTNGPIKSPSYAASVLDPWEGDGDCWCGGTGQSPNRRLKTTGKTHKVPPLAADIAILTKRVIPQVLRLEHISAKETVEPESMPKEVEVWIQLDEDASMFDHALSWSMAYFPEVDRYDPLIADMFVKIGHFVYPNETEVGHSGENFYLPKDVSRFGFATTKVLIRAKNNYGADDHTCFYQLLLNGKLLPMDE